MNQRLLIVEDEDLLCLSLQNGLQKSGYEVRRAACAEEAFQLMGEQVFDLMLLDIQLPGMNGLEILDRVKAEQPQLPVIMMTAYGEVGVAVQAMKLGAYDYISKPFLLDEIRLVIQKALENQSLREEVDYLRRQAREQQAAPPLLGEGKRLRAVRKLINTVSATPRTAVLIQGESGVGKEVVARLIHHQSRRSDKPFIKIDCSTIPETLMDTELFGHRRGSFTDAKEDRKGLFEQANGGTVFLDEIGEMKLNLQPKLLQVLETQTVRRVGDSRDIKIDVRIIAATNRDLRRMVQERAFRQDLYYRLKVMLINMPPLRERREDILPLAQYFLGQFNREFKKNVRELGPRARRLLLDYPWPGNVRELKNAMERAVLLADSLITPQHLPLELNDGSPELSGQYDLSLENLEKQHIKKVLAQVKGNRTKAAQLLKISRSTLWQKLKNYGMEQVWQ